MKNVLFVSKFQTFQLSVISRETQAFEVLRAFSRIATQFLRIFQKYFWKNKYELKFLMFANTKWLAQCSEPRRDGLGPKFMQKVLLLRCLV